MTQWRVGSDTWREQVLLSNGISGRAGGSSTRHRTGLYFTLVLNYYHLTLVLNVLLEIWKYVCVLHHLSTLRWDWYLEFFFVADKDLFGQLYGYWWHVARASAQQRGHWPCSPLSTQTGFINYGVSLLLHLPLPRSWKGVYWFHLARLSVCGQKRVCSVSSTILGGSISHILSSNFRRCVACKVCFNCQKFEILANSLNL